MQKIKRWWNSLPLDKYYRAWKRVPIAIRKPLILIIGSTVILTGIAMLIFPGPGWAAIFFGLAILATEFAFAERVRDWLIIQVKKWYHRVKNKLTKRKA